MMILKYFTYQIIPLAVSFGIGYWLLITADSLQKDNLRAIGTILGWILIVISIISSLFSFIFSVKMDREFFHMHKMMHNYQHDHYRTMPIIENEKINDNSEITPNENNETTEIGTGTSKHNKKTIKLHLR